MQSQDGAIIIAGGTGYIGRAVQAALQERGTPVIVLSRRPGAAPEAGYPALGQIGACRGVVNLAGANIAGGRWTHRRQAALRASRLDTTTLLCGWIRQQKAPPPAFVSASAIGYYGDTGDQPVDEDGPAGSDFGAQLCRDWERSIDLPAQTREVVLRFGVVLGPGGGALQRMLPAFRLGLGGRLGHGRQWMSWIALDDAVRLIVQALEEPKMRGVYNAVAPEPVRNAHFARALGGALHRPAVLPVPAAVLRLLLGEMSSLLLGSQRVVSARLPALGFQFRYPTLQGALMHALQG